MPTSPVGQRAKQLVPDPENPGFPAQQQEPPGLTDPMEPRPDHGEKTYKGHDRLKGLRALITGGDSGIGRAVAIAYAREGADVALNYLESEQDDAESTAELVRAEGRTCALLPGDLTDPKVCEQLPASAVEALGGLDVLVNNAGYQECRVDSLQALTYEEIDRVIRTNQYALLLVTKAAVPHMEAGSSIINVSSIQAYDPSEQLLAYAGTKAAINNMTVNLAADLGPQGIRVNAVAPGPIWTPLQPATAAEKKIEKFGANAPLGRAGQPSELAGAFVFLAAPAEASFVSGTVLGVTGGRGVF